MSLRPRRLVAVVLSVTLLSPCVAVAQSSKAGVVTTLEGNVTARRVALPAPVPLKFKDDVFLQDTVVTGDRSLARMLLGGKAVVTVRERSVLTITEIPGKSTIELESGKFALAVAREKMRPGEEVLIRTPNAMAGVRGTVVVTEVTRQGAQAGGSAPAVLTNFFVLHGTIVAQQIDPATRQPTGTPLPVSTLQAYSQAGNAPPHVAPVPPEQVGQITAGLQPSGPKGGADAGKEQVKAQAVQTAVSLITALTGTLEAPTTLATTPAAAVASASTSTSTNSSPTTAPVIPPVAETAPALVEEIKAAQQLGNIVLSGTQVRTDATAVATVTTSVVNAVGGQALITVAPGADITLAAELANISNSLVTGDGSGFDIRGRIRSTYAGAFINVDPTEIAVLGNFVSVIGAGAELTLAGPLLHDDGGVLVNGGSAARSFITALDSGVMTGTTSEPFISLTGSTVITNGSFFNARRSGATPTRVTLAGPLLQASGALIDAVSTAQLDQSGAPRLCCSVLGVGQGAVFTSTTASPLVTLADTTVLAGQHVFVVFDTTSVIGEPTITAPGTLSLAGPLVTASGSSLIGGLSDFLGIFRSSLTSASAEPLITLFDTAVGMGGISPINGATTPGRLVDMSGNPGVPATLTLNGPLLKAVGSTIETTDDVVGLFNESAMSSTTTLPLISVQDSSISAGRDGSFFVLASSSSGPKVTLAGPLLAANDATFANGTPQVVGSGNSPAFIQIRDGGQMMSTTTSPFVSLAGTTVDSAGNFLDVRHNGAALTLAGPLLSAVDSTIDVTSLGFGSACCNLVRLGQGGSVTSTSTAPLIQLFSSTVNAGPDLESGAHVVRIADAGSFSTDVASPSSMTLAGPLMSAQSSTLSSLFHTLSVERSTLTSAGTAPLIQLTSSQVFAGGTDPFTGLETAGQVAQVVASGSSGSVGPGAAIVLSGPLLTATGSSISATSNLIGVFNGGVLTAGAGSPLVSLIGSALTLGRLSDDGDLIEIQGVGGLSGTAGASVSAPGGLVSIGGGTSTMTGGFVRVGGGGQLVANHSTQPLVAIAGGMHNIASNAGRAALRITGRSGNTADENVAGNTLSLGTDQPLQHAGSGAFIDVSGGATVATQRILSLDTALLDATAPLLRVTGSGTSVTAAASGLDLVAKAKLTTTGPLFRVDGGSLTFTGDAVRVLNGSFLNVGGDLFHITAGGQVTVANGAALNATAGSVVSINGGLVNFASAGGTFTLANTLCSGGGCVTIGGVNVLLQNGAAAGNVSVTNPIKNAGGGSTSINPSGAFIIVNGATTKVTVNGY